MSDPRGHGPQSNAAASDLLGPLRSTLAQAARWERYRVIASLLDALAESDAASENGRAADVDQLEALTKKMQRLREEKAAVDDQLAALKADFAACSKQAEVESTRAKELQRIVEDQRGRMETTQKELDRVESELVQRNGELHRSEVQNEQLTIQLQRAQLAGGQTGEVNRLEERIHNLTQTVKSLEAERETLRLEKNAEIRRLEDQLAAAGPGAAAAAASSGGEGLLVELWERLIKAQLARGPASPNVQAAERVFDCVVVMTRFLNDLEHDVRPIVTAETRRNETLRRPWDHFCRQPELSQTVKEVLAVKPVGTLEQRVRQLMKWLRSSYFASSNILDTCGEELLQFLQGPAGMGTDPNRRIRDFIKDVGPDQFADKLRNLQAERLAEFIARGA